MLLGAEITGYTGTYYKGDVSYQATDIPLYKMYDTKRLAYKEKKPSGGWVDSSTNPVGGIFPLLTHIGENFYATTDTGRIEKLVGIEKNYRINVSDGFNGDNDFDTECTMKMDDL